MALSPNAARALEQVKMGLYILYGAAYFTEDEWIKIDGLIHKGKYVFTQGPPANFLDDELMSFDNDEEAEPAINRPDSFELIDKHNAKLSDEELYSASSKSADSPSSGDAPNIVSSEKSTPLEAFPPPPQTQDEAPFDLSSDMTGPPVEKSVIEQPAGSTPLNRSVNGGLTLGYTQADVDEIKPFNAGLTKAGTTSHPNYKKETYSESERSEDREYPPENDSWQGDNGTREQDQNYSSPAQIDDEERIQTWASGVESQGAGPASTTAPNNTLRTPVTLEEPMLDLVAKFQQTHGRLPRSPNDIYQPKNAAFRPLAERPASQASNKTTKTAKSIINTLTSPKLTPKSPGPFPPELNVSSGTVLIAQQDDQSSARLRIDIRVGDHIRVIKHVSGILHYGMNLRTNCFGQFPNTIFKKSTKPPGIAAPQSVIDATANRLRGPSVSTTFSKDLDSIERINASEWDDVPVSSKRKPVAPAPVRPTNGGLANSRFAALAETGSKSEESDPDYVHGMTREQVDRIVDDKLEQILRAQANGTKNNTKPPISTSNDTLKPVNPKSVTCWFWATPNKSCRFTAEECRDLHEYLPDTSIDLDPANLRSGKPTWGAAADVHLLPPSGPSSNKGKATCYFWANGGKCSYPANRCKYLHAWGSEGVALRPKWYGGKVVDWSRDTRSTSANANGDEGWGTSDGWGVANASGDGTETVEGEFVLEEVGASREDSGTIKYKPPHIKAAEEKGI